MLYVPKTSSGIIAAVGDNFTRRDNAFDTVRFCVLRNVPLINNETPEKRTDVHVSARIPLHVSNRWRYGVHVRFFHAELSGNRFVWTGRSPWIGQKWFFVVSVDIISDVSGERPSTAVTGRVSAFVKKPCLDKKRYKRIFTILERPTQCRVR